MLSTGLHFASESTSPAPRRDTHTKSCWAHSYFGCSCVTRPLAARGRVVAVTNSVPILTSDASHPLEGLKEDAGMLILPNEFFVAFNHVRIGMVSLLTRIFSREYSLRRLIRFYPVKTHIHYI